jgi:hypothetical protein
MKKVGLHLVRVIFALTMTTLAMTTLTSHAAMAGRRVALVVGNAKYEHAGTLTNTVNDADAIAALFTRSGFDLVDERRNVGVVEFKRAVREFLLAATDADVAVVYYSGHGIEVGGTNYMIPVDARLANNFDIEDEAISLDRIISATQPARKLRLIILDACRDNPFVHVAVHSGETRSVANGLASVALNGTDTLIAYAAKAGSVSYDGIGPNSPFTTALVKHIAEPGLDIRIALGKVRDDVLAATAGRQEPFVYGSLGGDTVSLVAAPPLVKIEPPAPQSSGNPIAETALDYQLAERVGTRTAWESFLMVHSKGFFADLAHAQLSKLAAAQPAALPDLGKTAGAAVGPAPARPGKETPPVGQTVRIRAEPQAPPQAPPQPPIEVANAPPTADQACKRDEAHLERLRSDPSNERVAQFARELACENLRPQVQRLLESLGGAPAGREPKSAAPPAAQSAMAAPHEACATEETRLDRLRADPDVAKVMQFARSFGCQDLRPQVQRLLESLGAGPMPAPPAEAATASASRGMAQAPEVAPAPALAGDHAANDAQACQRDAAELQRVRANPDRASALRFMRNLRCDDLRAQAARLLESVGN